MGIVRRCVGGACLLLIAAGSAAAQPKPDADRTVTVLAAKQKIAAFTLLKEPGQYFLLRKVPADAAPKGALTRFEELKDCRLTRTVPENGMVTKDDLLRQETNLAAVLPPGMRAVAIRVGADTTGGFVLPGSRVDVLCTLRRENEAVTLTILQDVMVLAVDSVPLREGEPRPAATTLTLAATPENAQKLALAAGIGELRVTLRPLGDDRKTPLEEAKSGDLVKPGKEPAKAEPVPELPKKERENPPPGDEKRPPAK